ncbi:MAG: serine--tRNA ligase [Aeriscardovia sp.]|nr:serine--tRNA ligase [Aeriscardovia sp.]
MIDMQLLRDDPDLFRVSQGRRKESVELVDEVLALDKLRRESLTRWEEARAEQKEQSAVFGKVSREEKERLTSRLKALAEKVDLLKADADRAEERCRESAWTLSNLVSKSAPDGGEDDYKVVEKFGQIRDFEEEGFEPLDHLALGEKCGGIDMARGAKVSGARFYFLTGDIARMELALEMLGLEFGRENGFIPTITPTLVRPEIMAGTGFLNQHAEEIYRLREPDDQYLVGTSEVALAGMHADEILDLDKPLKYCGFSSCYRREAGAAGKDTHGIIRVHQFNKVEMFVYCRPEESEKVHQQMLEMEKAMISKMEIPFRVIDIAAGDLGSSASRKFDCEGWMPTQGRYRELTSTSNCTQYQARRLQVRYRNGEKNDYCATLNGTLATTRWLACILENHQLKDGRIEIPAALRPFMGGQEFILPLL